jgi:hypothetical protein
MIFTVAQEFPEIRIQKRKIFLFHVRALRGTGLIVSFSTLVKYVALDLQSYLGSMCTAETPPPPPPAFGLEYEGTTGQPR